QKAIWTSPFHLHGRDARWAAPLAIGTGALIATDRSTASAIAKFDDQLNASRVVSYAGSAYGTVAVSAAFCFAGRDHRVWRDRRSRRLRTRRSSSTQALDT